MILGLQRCTINGFSVLKPFFHFLSTSPIKQRVSSLCCLNYFTYSTIMPPKRKITKSDVVAVGASEEAVPVKQKRGRKAKDVSETNGNNEENVEELPKRGRRTRKIEGDDQEIKQLKSEKPKRAAKEKSTAKKDVKKKTSSVESTTNSEDVKTTKRSRRKATTPLEEKPNKKDAKVSNEPAEEQNGEDDQVEIKSNRRGKKKTAEPATEDILDKKTKKVAKSKKTADEKNLENGDVGKKPKVLLNKTSSDWKNIDFTCTKKNGYGLLHNLIISTWNIGGVKSWINKGCMEYLTHESPDILCVQETKCNTSKLPDELKELNLYKKYWCSSKKEGYAGVGILTIKEPKNVTYGIGDEEQDEDGRCITAEYDKFYLVNVYVPNAGRKLVTLPKRLDWNESFMKYIKELDEKKPVVICGDMNVSHQAVDLARPQNNTKNAGFTPEERQGMTDFLNEGFVDVYRHMYPDEKDVYSFWTYMANARSKNIGWRLDYFIVSERLIKGVCDAKYRTQVLGSDHCPMTLFINI